MADSPAVLTIPTTACFDAVYAMPPGGATRAAAQIAWAMAALIRGRVLRSHVGGDGAQGEHSATQIRRHDFVENVNFDVGRDGAGNLTKLNTSDKHCVSLRYRTHVTLQGT